MATQDDFGSAGGSGKGPKIGGFLAGAFLCLGLGALVAVAFGGAGGFGDVSAPPPQVYTNF